MSAKRRLRRSQVLNADLVKYARSVGLELIEVRGLSQERLPLFYLTMDELKDTLEKSGDNFGTTFELHSGISVTGCLLH